MTKSPKSLPYISMWRAIWDYVSAGWTAPAVLVLVIFIVSSLSTRKRFKTIEKTIQALNDGVKHIGGFLQGKYPEFELFRKDSPVSLTSKGEKLVEHSNVRDIVTKYYQKMKIPDSYNEYDIQTLCFDFAEQKLENLLANEDLENLKKSAYENGYPLSALYKVIGILLRDMAITKRTEMSLAGIDKHTPSNQ